MSICFFHTSTLSKQISPSKSLHHQPWSQPTQPSGLNFAGGTCSSSWNPTEVFPVKDEIYGNPRVGGAFYLFIIYNPRYVEKVICKSMQIINWQIVTSWCSSKQSRHSIPWHCLLSKINCTRRALDQPDSENDWMLTYCTNMSGGYLLHLDGNIDHNMLAKFALHFLKFNTERSLFWWIIKSKVWNIPLRSWPKVSVGSTLKHFSEARNSKSQQ